MLKALSDPTVKNVNFKTVKTETNNRGDPSTDPEVEQMPGQEILASQSL